MQKTFFLLYIQSTLVDLRKTLLWFFFFWVASWISHTLHEASFLRIIMTTKLWSFRLRYLAVIFLKMNKASLPLRGKQLIIFVANDKIWDFKWKLKFWKTFITCCALDSFPILQVFSDEMGGDINESEVLLWY